MNSLNHFLRQYGILVIAGTFALLTLLERMLPLRKRTRAARPRLWVNAVLSLLTFAVAATCVRPVSLAVLRWASERSFGLLHSSSALQFVEPVLGFMLLDLSFYYWHRLAHQSSFLWRFHNVHHFDPDMDTSTGFRFHFGEVALSVAFRATQAALLGVSITTFLLYEFVFQIGTYFHHSNLRLPLVFEHLLNWVVVTPRMHGLHHSWIREETDSNYSVVFSFWDRIHRTYRRRTPDSNPTVGVPGYADSAQNGVRAALLAPFLAQREYWKKPR